VRRVVGLIITPLLFSLFAQCSAQTGDSQPLIRSIHIIGNRFFTERQILALMTTRINIQYSSAQVSADADRIYHTYAENGFYFAAVRIDSFIVSPDHGSGDVFLSISEGEQIDIDTIRIEGNIAFPSVAFIEIFDTRPGGYLEPARLERDLNAVISRYEQNGYPFASVRVKEITPVQVNGKRRLQIDIQIEESRKVSIDEVKITGNTATKEDVILREMRLMPHELYDERKMVNISERLKRLNIFARVEQPQPFITDSGGGIFIKVEEGNTSTFDGVLGYLPAAKATDRGVVTGMVNISMRNLFGSARKAAVRWLRDERKSQEVYVGYTEPWVLNIPLDLGITFNQRQQDTTYVQRKFGLTADIGFMESFRFGGMFTQEYVIPSNGTKSISGSRTTLAGINIRYDTRDDFISPVRGIFYSTDYQIGRKNVNDQTVTVQRLAFDVAYFIETFKSQVAVVSLHARGLTSANADISDLYRLGGTNTLRGYRENQFLGSRIAWTNTEYRFMLARHSFVFGFFDVGYYYRSPNDVPGLSAVQSLKYGYGTGLRIDTSLGNIGVSFAFGEGDTFSQGKVHVGLTNEF
jgi:outer membrane protein assembly factor BamA